MGREDPLALGRRIRQIRRDVDLGVSLNWSTAIIGAGNRDSNGHARPGGIRNCKDRGIDSGIVKAAGYRGPLYVDLVPQVDGDYPAVRLSSQRLDLESSELLGIHMGCDNLDLVRARNYGLPSVVVTVVACENEREHRADEES